MPPHMAVEAGTFLNGGIVMKISHLATAAFSVVLIATAHAQASKKDQEFLTQAAAGGLYEVEAGKLAQGKASSNRVKSFGSMLVKDHEVVNDELKALARSKEVSLPTAIPADKQLRLDELVIAKNFDRKFVQEVGLDDHTTDISLFEKASKDADDSAVKAFARKNLPMLKAHRKQAESLQNSLRK